MCFTFIQVSDLILRFVEEIIFVVVMSLGKVNIATRYNKPQFLSITFKV